MKHCTIAKSLKIYPYLSSGQFMILVQGAILSSLDESNALFHYMESIQLYLNKCNKCKLYNIWTQETWGYQPTPKNLNWLEIQQRIESKILLLVNKSLNGIAPVSFLPLGTNNLNGSICPGALPLSSCPWNCPCWTFIFICSFRTMEFLITCH